MVKQNASSRLFHAPEQLFTQGCHLMTKEQADVSLELLKAGDRREFARLVDKYSNSLYRLALKMLGNPLDAEDVLQNTFLQAFQHLRDFEGRSSVSTWLYRIASNEALMLIRKRHPEIALSDIVSEENNENDFVPAQFTDWGHLPEEELLSSESRLLLDRAIQNLPEIYRIVFILRDIEGLSITETSQALNLTETAIKTRLLRARLRLREEISRYYGEKLNKRSKK
jgi:RNA polymerase sigma-70 factor, ECF subfamily